MLGPDHGNESVATRPQETYQHAIGYDPKQSSAYTHNYVLLVLEVMQKMGLGPLQDVMNTEAKLMDVTAQIQSDLTTIQEYMTKIQNLSHSEGAWKMGGMKGLSPGQSGWYGPNAMNGIAYKEFHENPNVGSGSDPSDYTVQDDFKASTSNFINAFRDLFMGQTCSADDPRSASNFDTINVTKSDGKGGYVNQTITMPNVYDVLNANTTNGWGIMKQFGDASAFDAQPTQTATLLQQYTFYKYKLAAEQHVGKISFDSGDRPLLGISMDPGDSNCDGIGKSLFGLLNGFNDTVTVHRENDTAYASIGQFNETSGNFLNYILNDPYTIHGDANPGWWNSSQVVNIYGAFSYAAFNYFWTKNPNASTSSTDSTVPQPTNCYGGKYGWVGDKGLPSDGDKLSTWYSNAQSSSSLVSSTSNESSTAMQQYTSEVSQYQNIGQNIIKSSSESNIATVQNFKSG